MKNSDNDKGNDNGNVSYFKKIVNDDFSCSFF